MNSSEEDDEKCFMNNDDNDIIQLIIDSGIKLIPWNKLPPCDVEILIFSGTAFEIYEMPSIPTDDDASILFN